MLSYRIQDMWARQVVTFYFQCSYTSGLEGSPADGGGEATGVALCLCSLPNTSGPSQMPQSDCR
jgi:hypothetical protein